MEPLDTAFTELSISSAVFLEATELLLARLRTSSATTANPLPASPALAASTAAFRARILVWKAMSSMVLMILLISLEERAISSIAVIISRIWSLQISASFPAVPDWVFASRALSAVFLT